MKRSLLHPDQNFEIRNVSAASGDGYRSSADEAHPAVGQGSVLRRKATFDRVKRHRTREKWRITKCRRPPGNK